MASLTMSSTLSNHASKRTALPARRHRDALAVGSLGPAAPPSSLPKDFSRPESCSVLHSRFATGLRESQKNGPVFRFRFQDNVLGKDMEEAVLPVCLCGPCLPMRP
jgi:hypothetical protein